MLKDAQGRWRTYSLFKETATAETIANGYKPMFTLKASDPTGLPSLRTAYILDEDPTGYTTAMNLLGSWEHWQKIFSTKRFSEELSKWQEELDVRLRSKAIQALKDTALQEGAKGTAAARYLADAGYNGASKKRGRPTKEEVARERKIQAGITSELAEDEERILKMVAK